MSMIQEHAPIHSVRKIASDIVQLSFVSPAVSAQVVPGQFLNIRVEDVMMPFLRRPFSIFSVENDVVSFIFNIVGLGTKLLSQKKPGDTVDLIGPLGNGVFPLDDNDYETAVIVAGGLGVATFPFVTSRLAGSKEILTFVGARTSSHIVQSGLRNVHVATDDGSEGFHGTVVDLITHYLDKHAVSRPRIFSCGPTPMMRALSKFAG